MNNNENIRNDLKDIGDMIIRLEKEIHNNILRLSKGIFESQASMKLSIQEILNLCLKLDTLEIDSHNISRELLKRHITGMNLDQSFLTKNLVGLSLLILGTVVTGFYIVINDPRLLTLIAQKTQKMNEESPILVDIPQEWYNNKWFLLGMGCVCIFIIYGLSKVATYGLWDSILPASRKQFEKDSLDLNNKLNEINSDISRARQGAQVRIDNLSNLVDMNQESLKDIHERLKDTGQNNLSGAIDLLKEKLYSSLDKVEALQRGASVQSDIISEIIKELPFEKRESILPRSTTERGESSTTGREKDSTILIPGTSLFRHQLKKENRDLGSKGKDLDSHSPEGNS